MLSEVLEEGHAVRLVKTGVARFERVHDLLPAVPERAAERDDRGPRRAGRTGLERLAHGSQGEALCVALGEDAQAGQRAHQPMQRRRVQPHRSRQFGGVFWSGGQLIGQADFSRGKYDRVDPRGCAHLDQLDVRRDSPGCSLFVNAHALLLLLRPSGESLCHHLNPQKRTCAGDEQRSLVRSPERQRLASSAIRGTLRRDDAERTTRIAQHLDARRRDRVDAALVVDHEIVGARRDALRSRPAGACVPRKWRTPCGWPTCRLATRRTRTPRCRWCRSRTASSRPGSSERR